ncbi:hypothetical protein [Pseudosulfitobacter pseudonitzschiae]|nr:hypothetical protein [Pseudosulfitobacter pseudonitzschiae]
MTEYERKQLELLAQIAEHLSRIGQTLEGWDKIGLPDIKAS